ncbi:MAG: phosphoglycerate kinase [Alphaproteobacteria bacterium]
MTGSDPRLRTLEGTDFSGKRVLVRADLNVPLEAGKVRDATRIDRIVPTLKYLLDQGAKVIVISHLGRPGGQPVAEFSLAPVVAPLGALVGHSVQFAATDWRDGKARDAAMALKPGELLLCENLRFHPGETANDAEFVATLAGLADVYVNDAFSAAHRSHASTVGVAQVLPAYAGLAMQGELEALAAALSTPVRPVVAIVGGAKISTKIAVLENLMEKIDHLIIAGAMANTFLLARGVSVGASLCEPALVETATRIAALAKAKNCELLLPVDAVVAPELRADAPTATVAIDAVRDDQMILDVGPKTVAQVNQRLDGAKTVLWNGPFGAFEVAPFEAATVSIAAHVGGLTKTGKLISVAGGGDTVAALNMAGVAGQFTYVSTAGGAFLEWLEGKELPGVTALTLNHGDKK